MARQKQYKHSDTELSAILGREIQNAIGYGDKDELVEFRQKAQEYYLAEPFGNEIEGRSQVVSSDVADVVEWIMPQLLRIFLSGEKVVNFEPTGPEDEAGAEQATDYVNYIVQRDNDGFVVLYEFFKDALLFKNGIVKAQWDEREEESFESYEGLDEDDFLDLVTADDVEVVGHTAYEDEVPVPSPEEMGMPAAEAPIMVPGAGATIPMELHDVMLKRTRQDGRVFIECLPPEEFLIDRRAKTIPAARFCAHRSRKTRTELIEMGIDRNLVESLASYDDDFDEESNKRREDIGTEMLDEASDKSTEVIDVYECYIRLDMDDDGKAELWKILCAGAESTTILKKELWDKAYFASISPILTPHRFHGRSIAELIMDLQLIKSTVMRQLLDNMYNINNGREVVSVDSFTEDTFDDLLNQTVGGKVRVKGDVRAAIQPLITESLHDLALPLLDWIDTVRENRTGVTKYNQGLDADTLNKTAQGINQILGQAAMRIELIARLFAETGVKELFRHVLELVCKHQDRERMVRLREEWVPMDPTQWNHKMDLSTAVGLGTGDKERQFMVLQQVLEQQKEIIAADAAGGMVDRKNIYNTLEKMVEAAGLKSIEPFFREPKDGQPLPGQGNQPDPIAQAELAKVEVEKGKLELDRMKLQLERDKMLREDDRKRDELDADIALRATEIYAKHGMQADIQMIRAMVEMNREESRERTAAMQAAARAQQRPAAAAE